MKYRAEIDGMRAIAVLAVIFFHAGFKHFSGGYVGVDIFFVISGYLITTQITQEIKKSNFSLLYFYERRARRILPLLFAVCLITSPLAFIHLSNRDFYDYAQSLIASSLFSSNILFFFESGYFDSLVDTKPLLHTWSLALEEQYYLVFPLLLLMLKGWNSKKVFASILLLTISSLLLAQAFVEEYPSATFYLLPFRGWEILIGALLACFEVYWPKQLKKINHSISNCLSFIGLVFIITSIFIFSPETPFPSFYTLLPTIGSVLILGFARPQTFAHYILRSRLLVGCGLISYSLYLWHQPLFAIVKYRRLLEPSSELMMFYSLLLFPLSYFSWRWIEQPWRNKNFLSQKSVFQFSGLGILLFTALSSAFIFSKNERALYAGEGLAWVEKVQNSNPRLILYGDSHARQYFRSLEEVYGESTLLSKGACLALPGILGKYEGADFNSKKCAGLLLELKNLLKQHPTTPLFIAYRWDLKVLDSRSEKGIGNTQEELGINALAESLKMLLSWPENHQRKIVLIGSVPSAASASPGMHSGYERCEKYIDAKCPLFYPKTKGEGLKVNEMLSKLTLENANLSFIDPYESLCDEKGCHLFIKDQALYSDHAHLTRFGADLVIDQALQQEKKQIPSI
ncbi:acyltransferase [bacterium]|nr:acyltransferase [bacterium]